MTGCSAGACPVIPVERDLSIPESDRFSALEALLEE
jgi:hypothetical protein